MFPPEMAEIVVIPDTLEVVITAAPGVNVMSSPYEVPALFTASILKWYVVPVVRPVMFTDSGNGVEPVPADCELVEFP